MALNSYKQWRLLNETFGALGPIPLGLKTPHSIGVVGAQLGEEDPDGEEIEEGKKCGKCSKKMDGDVDLKAKPEDEDGPPSDEEAPDDEAPEDEESDDDDDDDGDDDDGDKKEIPDEEDDSETDITKKPLFMKKKCKKAMKKAMKKGMKKEDKDWWNSIHDMMLTDPDTDKSWDGFSRIEEDALLPPTDANQGLADQTPEANAEPQPGEVGFAPQAKVMGP